MFEQEIARGVAVLDEHSTYKTGWVFHVDTDILDMSDWSRCVLGQLYGEFYRAADELRKLTSAQPHTVFTVDHGFELTPNVGETLSLEEYRVLGVEWRAHITELRFQRRALLDGVSEITNGMEEEAHEHE